MRFKQVDVFTKVPFLGNPVAVVIGAEGLKADAMQRIARWTNLSETTFLLKSDRADYRVRIFTPSSELPFAGHPTLGSAHAALESGFVPTKTRLTQECAAGVLDLAVEEGRIYVKGPQAKVAAARHGLGVKLVGEPQRVDVGPVWIIGEMADARALAQLKPDLELMRKASAELKADGITLFAKSDDCVGAIHVRSFAPAHNIPEDPVCGSGNIAVAAFLRKNDALEKYGESYVARQGAALGRDGRVFMKVDKDGIWLGGDCVTCIDGTLAV